MSFASDIRGELAHTSCEDICCARAELAAALRAGGGISFRGSGRYALSFTSLDGGIVRHYYALLKRFWNISGEISVITMQSLAGDTHYRLTLPEDCGRLLLQEIGLWDEHAMLCVRETPHAQILQNSCCRSAFLRSAFLICGTADNPERDYHLEFACPTEEFADIVISLINSSELVSKKSCRKNKYVVYLKRAESISDVLTLMGAPTAMLKLESIRVRKSVAADINRQMNCDSSNIARTTGAAQAQLDDIALIEEAIGLANLNGTLRAVAEARISYPDATLTALGKLMEPPVGKSGVNARMRRIGRLAESIRNGTWKPQHSREGDEEAQ